MWDICEIENDLNTVGAIQRNINIIIAALLLTGQITTLRLIVDPGGFSLSVGGPLTGRTRLEGKFGNKTLSLILDIGDILLAILLIIDEIRLSGIFITPGGFSFNVTGPIFGVPKDVPTLPNLEKIFYQFKLIVSENYNIDPQIFIK